MAKYHVLKDLIDGRRVYVRDICSVLGLSTEEVYNLFSCDKECEDLSLDDTVYLEQVMTKSELNELIYRVYELLYMLIRPGNKIDDGDFHRIMQFIDENYRAFYSGVRYMERKERDKES